MTDERLTRRIDHQGLLIRSARREAENSARARENVASPGMAPRRDQPHNRRSAGVHPEPVDQVPRRRKVPHRPGRKRPRKSAAVFRIPTRAASRCAHEAFDADEIRRCCKSAVRPEQPPLKPVPETGWLRAQGHRGCLPGRL